MRIRTVTCLAALVLAAGAGTGAAAAREPTITEFSSGLSASSFAWGITAGPLDKLWFSLDGTSAFGSIAAGDGLITEWNGAMPLAGSPKGIAYGPDGNVWIAESSLVGAIARVTPDGTLTEFTTGLTPSDPWDVTAGPDGNVWFVSRSPAFIGRITPEGTITEFSAGLTPNSEPTAITAGDDGNLWFTESASPGRIGRITPDGVITENSIGLPPNMAPTDITAGPDGNVWFTLSADPGGIGRITPEGDIEVFDEGLTRDSRPTGIAAGTDGALWFTEAAGPGRIGRITKSGDITEYSAGLTPGRSPWFITAGPDGNMWFTENAPGAIARIGLPPLARTRGVDDLSDNSALLQAKIRPNAQETRFRFEYGEGKSFKYATDWQSAGAGWDPVETGTRIANLKPEKDYRYRVVAENDSGTTIGGDGVFITEELEPELGELLVAEPTGRVRYKRPGGRWRPLATWGAELPNGVAFDARRGSVALTSAMRDGSTQRGRFGGGILQVRQPRRAGGRVDIFLRGGDFRRCARPRGVSRTERGADTPSRAAFLAAAARGEAARRGAVSSGRRRVRRLWGRDDGGRYRTHGRQSHATVRGTRWLTVDRCGSTLTRVSEGAVVVRDLARRRSVLVRAGESYVAHRRRAAARRRR